jgi:hypothetical protein
LGAAYLKKRKKPPIEIFFRAIDRQPYAPGFPKYHHSTSTSVLEEPGRGLEPTAAGGDEPSKTIPVCCDSAVVCTAQALCVEWSFIATAREMPALKLSNVALPAADPIPVHLIGAIGSVEGGTECAVCCDDHGKPFGCSVVAVMTGHAEARSKRKDPNYCGQWKVGLRQRHPGCREEMLLQKSGHSARSMVT